MSWREEAMRRLNVMCGVDENGALLPPPPGMGIDRTAWSWWRNPWAQLEPDKPNPLDGTRLWDNS